MSLVSGCAPSEPHGPRQQVLGKRVLQSREDERSQLCFMPAPQSESMSRDAHRNIKVQWCLLPKVNQRVSGKVPELVPRLPRAHRLSYQPAPRHCCLGPQGSMRYCWWGPPLGGRAGAHPPWGPGLKGLRDPDPS